MGQFDQPIKLALKDDKEALLKWCFNRCFHAFNIIYDYEKKKMGSFWRSDERYYEHGMKILYERFCYAMAIIVRRFHSECVTLHDADDPRFMNLSIVENKTLSFQISLSMSVDNTFKHSAGDMGFSDGTIEYYDRDYSGDAYEKFWEKHRRLESQISILRSSFAPEERIDLHGFVDDDDNEENCNLDCLHMMRICQRSSDVDVQTFLNFTKRHYLPSIINGFMTAPRTDIFAKWWQFWKR